MAILRCHKVLLGLSVLGVMLLIGALSSPGWFRVHYISLGPGDGWEDHLTEDGPISMTKRESEPAGRHRHHHHELQPGAPKFVSVSAGLWYFVTCVEYADENWETRHKCHHSSYCHASREAERLPEEMRGVGLESIYINIGDVARFGLMEFQVEAVIGMVCAVVGMFFGFRYVRGHFTKRGAGLATFILHIIAGVLFAVIFGKAITLYKIGMLAMTEVYGYNSESVYLYTAVPYSMLVVSLASVVILGISLVFLCILSKGPRKHIDVISACGKGPGVPFGMISPPGYKPFVGLTEPPTYKEDGPLPEKEPL